jgi:hypothetical protein
MCKQFLLACLVVSFALSLSADQTPAFYFGGKRLFVGMPKADALVELSDCCRLSPPPDSNERQTAPYKDKMLGHFIFSKDGSPSRMLGTIFFADGKVVRITRPLDADKFDPQSDDVVALARSLDRSLESATGDSQTVTVTVRHDRASNGAADILTFAFPNGRAVVLQTMTLDTPSTDTGKRDSVSLDESLESPHR